jgi:hypothetical protein
MRESKTSFSLNLADLSLRPLHGTGYKAMMSNTWHGRTESRLSLSTYVGKNC